MDPNYFFETLNFDIRTAKTKMALKVLQKRAKLFTKEIVNSPLATKKVTNSVKKSYKESLGKIRAKEELLC